MIQTVIEWGTEISWSFLVLPPFFIWFIAGMLIVSFGPEINKKRSNKKITWKKVLYESLKNALKVRWQLFFTAINLTFLSLVLLVLGVIQKGLLPGLPEEIVDVLGLAIIWLLFVGKCKSIYQDTSSRRFKSSIKYLYRGISNPFSWESL